MIKLWLWMIQSRSSLILLTFFLQLNLLFCHQFKIVRLLKPIEELVFAIKNLWFWLRLDSGIDKKQIKLGWIFFEQVAKLRQFELTPEIDVWMIKRIRIHRVIQVVLSWHKSASVRSRGSGPYWLKWEGVLVKGTLYWLKRSLRIHIRT